MIAVLVVMWVFTLSGSKKQKKKKQELLATMKKGTKIQTIGGIIGTVVEIKDDVITLKIDENTNTRMRVNRAAVSTVIEDKD